MRSAVAFALASLAVCHPACGARSEQAHVVLSQFREALTLSLTVPSNVVVGEETRLRFRVQNSSRHTIDGCVGPSRNVWIIPEDDTQGNEPISISEHVVDHPGCQQRYRLAPVRISTGTRLPGCRASCVGLPSSQLMFRLLIPGTAITPLDVRR